MGLNVLGHR